ncbi:cyclic beta 1-2 glucan synthase [Klebsiella variicola]|uniref:Cyclic beta 1-2 glucan synthase n=1 Tax=Klebsiella variicola TaxID=244366 RepID=A0A7H4M7Q6_KLEVA|nr:cyclic beta 1-2 glucan synthase [Klebsiella variicola]
MPGLKPVCWIKRAGFFVRNGEHLSAEDKLLLMSVACLYLDDRAGGINEAA